MNDNWDDELWRITNPGMSAMRGLIYAVPLLIVFWSLILWAAWTVMS